MSSNSEQLKPCPFCGSESLKHYTRQARGEYRGVVQCKDCGARLDSYSDPTHKIAKAYMGDWDEAKAYANGQAYDAVAAKWNSRAEVG